MEVTAYKIPLVKFRKEIVLEQWLEKTVPVLSEKDILVMAGKVISIVTGRISSNQPREVLIRQESEQQFGQGAFILTKKNGRLVPNAGIDTSNVEEGFVLWPEEPQQVAEQIWQFLRKLYSIQYLGIILTDSNITPLRRGTIGIGIGWCGFEALKDYRGKKDLFGKPLKVSVANVLDHLASSAVLMMGEGNEQKPFVLIKRAPVNFQNRVPSQSEKEALQVEAAEDLFSFYKNR